MTDAWIPPPVPDPAPDALAEFWESRPIFAHILKWARIRRVGPWALLACILVRTVAATTPKIVLPALTGGHVSLNLYAGIVAFTGGGKGTAEKAAREAVNLPSVDVVGPGSGEGIGHLFKAWDQSQKAYVPVRSGVIISAPEISTLNALKGRQSSTLMPELNKAWMGEPLGFAYAAKEKRLSIEPHDYRLCLAAGIQPANAGVILDDVDSGTPARWLWAPTHDHDAPILKPEGRLEPGKAGLWRSRSGTTSSTSTRSSCGRWRFASPQLRRSILLQSIGYMSCRSIRSRATRFLAGSRPQPRSRCSRTGPARSQRRTGSGPA
jgi:hypothetical protein